MLCNIYALPMCYQNTHTNKLGNTQVWGRETFQYRCVSNFSHTKIMLRLESIKMFSAMSSFFSITISRCMSFTVCREFYFFLIAHFQNYVVRKRVNFPNSSRNKLWKSFQYWCIGANTMKAKKNLIWTGSKTRKRLYRRKVWALRKFKEKVKEVNFIASQF